MGRNTGRMSLTEGPGGHSAPPRPPGRQEGSTGVLPTRRLLLYAPAPLRAHEHLACSLTISRSRSWRARTKPGYSCTTVRSRKASRRLRSKGFRSWSARTQSDGHSPLQNASTMLCGKPNIGNCKRSLRSAAETLIYLGGGCRTRRSSRKKTIFARMERLRDGLREDNRQAQMA